MRIDVDAARAQRIFREIEREAIGVVELEGDIARQRIALAQAAGCFVEQFQTARQRIAEAGFFELQCFGDQRLRRASSSG